MLEDNGFVIDHTHIGSTAFRYGFVNDLIHERDKAKQDLSDFLSLWHVCEAVRAQATELWRVETRCPTGIPSVETLMRWLVHKVSANSCALSATVAMIHNYDEESDTYEVSLLASSDAIDQSGLHEGDEVNVIKSATT